MKKVPTIDMTLTGKNIKRLRRERGLTVSAITEYMGFSSPRAVYKWQNGESLPSVDNLFALSVLLGVTMDEIIVAR